MSNAKNLPSRSLQVLPPMKIKVGKLWNGLEWHPWDDLMIWEYLPKFKQFQIYDNTINYTTIWNKTIEEGGRSWQSFGGGKNGYKKFRKVQLLLPCWDEHYDGSVRVELENSTTLSENFNRQLLNSIHMTSVANQSSLLFSMTIIVVVFVLKVSNTLQRCGTPACVWGT